MKQTVSNSSFNKSLLAVVLISTLILGCSKIAIQDLKQGEATITEIPPTGGNPPNDPPPPTTPPTDPPPTTPPPPVVGCQGVSCTLDPLTSKPAVTTILLTLGDQSNSALVINGASSQLIAETVVRYTTPAKNPKILVVLDPVTAGEDLEDIDYITDVLLVRYNVTVLRVTNTGLDPSQTVGYDAIWYNNPGHPVSSQKTLATLLAFKGGIVLQGDDMARGVEGGTQFSMTPLTGLNFIDNGPTVVCAGQSYNHNDNNGYQYRVSIDPTKIQGDNASVLNFRYGNDIDNTTVANSNVEVLATAVGGPDTCTETRPVIVRYLKN